MKNPPKETFRQRIHMAAEQLDLQGRRLNDVPQLILDGDKQLLIERHMGIAEYGTDRIRIVTKVFTIEIVGEKMHLVAMDRDNIRIRGAIRGVQYLYKE